MNQNELRIGNLLHYKLFADNISVRGIGKNCIWLNDNEHAGPISIEHLESIPLTEEWLEKLGLTKSTLDNDFEPNEPKWYSWIKGVFNLEIQQNGEIWFELYSHYKHIKWVHELQNLYFALTEEELILQDK
jgi:hypothetical protein